LFDLDLTAPTMPMALGAPTYSLPGGPPITVDRPTLSISLNQMFPNEDEDVTYEIEVQELVTTTGSDWFPGDERRREAFACPQGSISCPSVEYTCNASECREVQLQESLPDGLYGWRARAIDSVGNVGPWRPCFNAVAFVDGEQACDDWELEERFSMPAMNPSTFTVSAGGSTPSPAAVWPLPGAVCSDPDFIFTTVPDFFGYQIEIYDLGFGTLSWQGRQEPFPPLGVQMTVRPRMPSLPPFPMGWIPTSGRYYYYRVRGDDGAGVLTPWSNAILFQYDGGSIEDCHAP
jgi:hypothetical protein